MKAVHIFVGLALTALVGVKLMAADVNARINAVRDPVVATVTKVSETCYIHRESDDLVSSPFACASEAEFRSEHRYYDKGVTKTGTLVTYRYTHPDHEGSFTDESLLDPRKTSTRVSRNDRIDVLVLPKRPESAVIDYSKL